MTAERRKLGIAISGGGHRAALWGLGTLLYLVDAGLNRDVTVISSVSGGSITNGVVAKKVSFDQQTTDSRSFRSAMQPLLTHITEDGLFFYGSATNAYLWIALTLAALTAAAWFLSIVVILMQVGRYLFDVLSVCSCNPVNSVPVWLPGVALALAFVLLSVIAAKQTGKLLSMVTLTSVAFAVIGLLPLTAKAFGVDWGFDRWNLDPGLPIFVAVALVLTFLTLSWFARRSEVAERALDRVHFDKASLGDSANGGKPDGTHHVICATELQSGVHAYFTNRFVYNFQFGVSFDTRSIPLAKAVQSSAALPGAFSPQRLPTKNLEFDPPETGGGSAPAGATMILVDGGVYDNMAEQWVLGLADRRERWTATVPGSDKMFATLLEDVDQVILANASAGWSWRRFGAIALRFSRVAREVASLGREQSIMYNTIGRRRRAHLFDLWGTGAGTFVEVDQDPAKRIPPDAKFAPVRDWVSELDLGGSTWENIVKRSDAYPTILRRIPPEIARRILWHAYIDTAVAAALYLDRLIPQVGVHVSLEDFARIDGHKLVLVDPGSGPVGSTEHSEEARV